MISTLLLAAVLSVVDPAGDSFGNGTVEMPSAVVFRSPSAFDARQFEVLDGAEFAFAMTFDQLSNPWGLDNGFSLPIFEVYLDSGGSGSAELLPGSGMRLAPGDTWTYAFRVHGDSFSVFRADEGGGVADVTQALGASLTVEGNTVALHTRLPRPRRFSVYAMVGSYDPFSVTGWRPLEGAKGPWNLSSRDQSVPVLDVLAERPETQVTALGRGVLPEIRASVQYNGWLVLTVAGALLGLAGLFGRIFVPGSAPATESDTVSVPGAAELQSSDRYMPLALPVAVDGGALAAALKASPIHETLPLVPVDTGHADGPPAQGEATDTSKEPVADSRDEDAAPAARRGKALTVMVLGETTDEPGGSQTANHRDRQTDYQTNADDAWTEWPDSLTASPGSDDEDDDRLKTEFVNNIPLNNILSQWEDRLSDDKEAAEARDGAKDRTIS